MILKQEIEDRLNKTFSPTYLKVIDDSAKHVGHAGNQNGAGHFTVEIAADFFQNQTKVQSHQAIYSVLNDLIPEKIHALRIIAKS